MIVYHLQLSGNMELQSRTGAAIHFLKGSPVEFDFVSVQEGDVFEFGAASFLQQQGFEHVHSLGMKAWISTAANRS
jgi:hypothetical protein